MTRPKVLLFKIKPKWLGNYTLVSPIFSAGLMRVPGWGQGALGEDMAGTGCGEWMPWTLYPHTSRLGVATTTGLAKAPPVAPLPPPQTEENQIATKSWGFRTLLMTLHWGLNFDALISAPWKQQSPTSQQVGWGIQHARILGTLSCRCWATDQRRYTAGRHDFRARRPGSKSQVYCLASHVTSGKLLDLFKVQFSFCKMEKGLLTGVCWDVDSFI